MPRDEWDGLAESCGWQNDDLLLAKDENPPEKDGFACPNCGGNDFTWLGIPEGDPDGD